MKVKVFEVNGEAEADGEEAEVYGSEESEEKRRRRRETRDEVVGGVVRRRNEVVSKSCAKVTIYTRADTKIEWGGAVSVGKMCVWLVAMTVLARCSGWYTPHNRRSVSLRCASGTHHIHTHIQPDHLDVRSPFRT